MRPKDFITAFFIFKLKLLLLVHEWLVVSGSGSDMHMAKRFCGMISTCVLFCLVLFPISHFP